MFALANVALGTSSNHHNKSTGVSPNADCIRGEALAAGQAEKCMLVLYTCKVQQPKDTAGLSHFGKAAGGNGSAGIKEGNETSGIEIAED